MAKSSWKISNQLADNHYIHMICLWWTLFHVEKYHTVWGPLEANYVTWKYMYVKYDLNYGVTRSRLLRWAFPIQQSITKYFSLKYIFQVLWTILDPLFKGLAASALYQKKGPVILKISCSTTVQKFLTVLEISVQVCFRGRTCNSLKGPYRNKI